MILAENLLLFLTGALGCLFLQAGSEDRVTHTGVPHGSVSGGEGALEERWWQGMREAGNLGSPACLDVPVWHGSSEVSAGRASTTEMKELPPVKC